MWMLQWIEIFDYSGNINEMVLFKTLLLLIILVDKLFTMNIVYDNDKIDVPPQEKLCHDFVTPQIANDISTEREQTLQSPQYPHHYPQNIDCVHVIRATQSNMIINLEFRETFEIEESVDCANDFLQINDGPFGFSKMLSKLCGKELHKETIRSTTQYLWLRFYSDKTITNRGFKIIFKFAYANDNSQPVTICYRKLSIPSGRSVKLTHDNIKEYSHAKLKGVEECVIDISAAKDSSIFISMEQLTVSGMGNLGQFIEIYDRITTPIKIGRYKNYILINEKSNFEKVFLKYRRSVIRISFRNIESIMRFQFTLTALIVKKPDEKCLSGEHMCQGSFCIHNTLLCDNEKNCPYEDDEMCWNGKPKDKNISDIIAITDAAPIKESKEETLVKDQYRLHGIILGGISLFLLCMLIACIIHSVKQSKKNSKKRKKSVAILNVRNGTNIIRYENQLLRPSIPSTMTLTTDILSKKVYKPIKSKPVVNKERRNENENISFYYKHQNRPESTGPNSFSNIPSRNSCSPDREKISKSISNVNQFVNRRHEEHLPGCTSLPNFSTESVNNLFEDDYPVVEEITISKPIRIQYYA